MFFSDVLLSPETLAYLTDSYCIFDLCSIESLLQITVGNVKWWPLYLTLSVIIKRNETCIELFLRFSFPCSILLFPSSRSLLFSERASKISLTNRCNWRRGWIKVQSSLYSNFLEIGRCIYCCYTVTEFLHMGLDGYGLVWLVCTDLHFMWSGDHIRKAVQRTRKCQVFCSSKVFKWSRTYSGHGKFVLVLQNNFPFYDHLWMIPAA